MLGVVELDVVDAGASGELSEGQSSVAARTLNRIAGEAASGICAFASMKTG